MQTVNISVDGQKIPATEYCGFTVSSVAAATVILYDGFVGGPILETLSLAAGQSIQDCYIPVGPTVTSRQIWVAITGAPTGAVRII